MGGFTMEPHYGTILNPDISKLYVQICEDLKQRNLNWQHIPVGTGKMTVTEQKHTKNNMNVTENNTPKTTWMWLNKKTTKTKWMWLKTTHQKQNDVT